MSEYTPKVSMILPCKGIDPGFENNINALYQQDYPDYEMIFVTATEDDPSHVFLKDFLKRKPHKIPAKLIVAGISSVRGQKINNMLEALKHVRDDTEVFVFVDSDIRPKQSFLRYLVNPLQYEHIGVTTGIRWYLPEHGNLGSMLRSIWAAGALPLLIDKRHNFVYGGANSMKRKTFEKANIRNLFEHALNDSFIITNAIKSVGLQIYFVPQCIVVSHEDSTLSDTIEFTNRQTITTRIYSPPFWWTVFLTYSFSNLMLLIGVILLIFGILVKGTFILPGLLMLSLIPLEIINAAYLLPVVVQMIPEHGIQIEKLKWKYYCITPFTSILMMVNSLVSLTTNEFTWRGVRYRLVSPSQTEIISYNNYNN